MKLELEPGWRLNGEPADPVLFELLEAIARSGSLARASGEVGYSYRHVWGLLAAWERRLGQRLARLERGRGARLTPFGEKLLELRNRARAHLAREFAALADELSRELTATAPARKAVIRIHASHDLALAQLRDAAGGGAGFELEFHGSVDNLRSLARGECDLAGFHVAERSDTPEIARLLEPREHRLIGVAVREQGLIVARGNPKRIESLADIARAGVRLINRQRGSGTRIEFDRLLAGAGIGRDGIEGYPAEEFTHLAVAATVAGGMADVGFGIHAAAAQLGLGFIPLVNERYLLAARAGRLAGADLRQLVSLLRSDQFRAILSRLPGYDGAIAGRIMSVEEGLAGPRPLGARPS